MGLFDGKVAIVTGAGRGVGKAEAMLLAKEGAKVVVNDLGGSADGIGGESSVASQVVQEIKDAGGTAVPNFSDISTLDGADALIWTALSKFNRVDVLINNAGILRDRTLLNMSEFDWDKVHQVHAKGTFLCSRAAARQMKAQGTGGAIINTTSISGMAGNFGQSNYGAAKMAIFSFTKITAMELAKFDIRVNCVSPSGFTRLVGTIPGLTDQQDMEAYKKISSVEPTARLAIFLASDLAKDLTGRVMASYGGIHGNNISEFKMINSPGFQKHGDMFTIDEIAENIEKMLCTEPDITMKSGAYEKP